MAEFAPPAGPPPPKVPEGWKAQYSDEWKEWFFVNLHTGISTWEKPIAPAPFPSTEDYAPPPPQPSYMPGSLRPEDNKSTLHSNNPYNNSSHTTHSSGDMDADARLAARLQAEENASARPTTTAAQQEYERTQMAYQPHLDPQELPPREAKRSSGLSGLLSKLTGKHGHQTTPTGYPPPGHANYPQQGYGGYPPPQPSSPFGGYPNTYGAGNALPARKPGGGGMGMAGGAALGLGAGALGGALLANELNDHDNDYGGGDGGGDYGGGDYGGDDGGGDFGGGGDDGGGGD